MTREDGKKLHDSFRPLLDAGEHIVLDFAGTTVFVSAFFNVAIGQLLEKYSQAELAKRIRFVNLPAAAAAPLKKSIETAERYYRDPQYRAALDQVLKEPVGHA